MVRKVDDGAVGQTAASKVKRSRRGSDEIRALIKAAARGQFAERGYAGATTRHIAEVAEVAEPLIFNNFGNKERLFAEAVVDPFNAGLSALIVSTGEELPATRERRSAHFVHKLYPFLRDNADLLHALVKSSGDTGGETLGGLDGYFSQAENSLRTAFERSGQVLDIEPGTTVRYAFGLLASAVLFRDWFYPGGEPTEAETEAALARMLFKMTEPLTER